MRSIKELGHEKLKTRLRPRGQPTSHQAGTCLTHARAYKSPASQVVSFPLSLSYSCRNAANYYPIRQLQMLPGDKRPVRFQFDIAHRLPAAALMTMITKSAIIQLPQCLLLQQQLRAGNDILITAAAARRLPLARVICLSIRLLTHPRFSSPYERRFIFAASRCCCWWWWWRGKIKEGNKSLRVLIG